MTAKERAKARWAQNKDKYELIAEQLEEIESCMGWADDVYIDWRHYGDYADMENLETPEIREIEYIFSRIHNSLSSIRASTSAVLEGCKKFLPKE